uniref:BphC protein n=1 Tax=Burkholderia sp. TSN101 TaxID=76943 RepID=Q9K5C2_9BURK|nr:BphC [Burkholderia sp. TSN101]
MSIKSLGYLGFAATDVAAWQKFLTQKLGLMDAGVVDAAALCRADSHAWRIAVQPGESDDLAFAGFEVADDAALARMGDKLRQAGVEVCVGDADALRRRGVLGMLSFTDPFGLLLEIYYGATEVYESPLVPAAGVTGFVTGEQGLGHFVRCVPEAEKALAFYVGVLGFQLSDVIDMKMGAGVTIPTYFLHCNERHHTLALAAFPLPKRIHHFMLEVRTIDEVGFAYDRLDTDGLITSTLGRHTNDHMVSFYAATPCAGVEVEYGWGARMVDASWSVARHDHPSMWGHKSVRRNS